MVQETGAIHTGIAILTNKLGKKEFVVIPVMMFLFSMGGALYGMAEIDPALYTHYDPSCYVCGI